MGDNRVKYRENRGIRIGVEEPLSRLVKGYGSVFFTNSVEKAGPSFINRRKGEITLDSLLFYYCVSGFLCNRLTAAGREREGERVCSGVLG